MIFRHVVTAGHCVCGPDFLDTTNVATRCLESSENQIQPGKNTIVIAGGSNSANELDDLSHDFIGTLKWNINAAYIMDDNIWTYDVGTLELKESETFFNKARLNMNTDIVYAKFVPICLGSSKLSEKVDMSQTEFKGVGWGRQYEEKPSASYTQGVRDPRDPVYSSCMTNEVSPESWRFQNCDMKRIRKRLSNTVIWSCEKLKPPPGYEDGQAKQCQDYFRDFKRKMMHGKSPTINLPDQVLDDIDVINIDSGPNSKIEKTCYDPEKLSQNGWCYLKDYQGYKVEEKEAWGTCSSSCDSKLMRVLISNYKLTHSLILIYT